MARYHAMGHFVDGNGAIEGIEYTEEFDALESGLRRLETGLEQLGETLTDRNETVGDYLDGLCDRFDDDEERLFTLLEDNQHMMKEISRQLDILIELVGGLGDKLDERSFE